MSEDTLKEKHANITGEVLEESAGGERSSIQSASRSKRRQFIQLNLVSC